MLKTVELILCKNVVKKSDITVPDECILLSETSDGP